jgi:putative transposase
LNYQLRKIIKNRGHFPNDVAAVKLLWLAICNIEDKRAMQRAKERKGSTGSRLLEGAATAGWTQALGALAVNFPDRINQYL